MIGVCFVFVVWLLAGCCRSSSVLDFVDPLIGSGGQGFGAASVPPGAQLPFSSVRLSPDTSHSLVPWTPFDHFGGYHWNDNEIRVFSHLHTQVCEALFLFLAKVFPSFFLRFLKGSWRFGSWNLECFACESSSVGGFFCAKLRISLKVFSQPRACEAWFLFCVS